MTPRSEHHTLGLSADEVLTTTRSVRKRLDLDRPVPRDVLLDCIDIAHQSPTGSNSQRWRWMMIEDPAKKLAIAELYRMHFAAKYAASEPPESGSQADRINQSAQHLADHLHEVPVLVIPLLADRMGEGIPSWRQASRWGGILPAVWSFMLALRERGIGSHDRDRIQARQAPTGRGVRPLERVVLIHRASIHRVSDTR